MSFGLTVSALVTAVRNELPLYQAIVVTDLVWLANWAIFMALATYNRHPRGSHAVQYTAIGQMYISMAGMLYLWARAPTLDAEFEKTGSETVFVVLFKETSATGVGRTLALVVTAVLLVGYTVVAAVFLSRRFAGTLKQGEKTSAPTRLPPSLGLDPHLIILGLFILVPYVITVGSTELQIRRNQLCPDNAFWGFGQILAITVTIVPVVVTVQAFRKYGWRQRARFPPESGPGAADAHAHV
ncbi:hypothetical protein DFH08DRAFT_865686 [Mycena albidolilacea]|uniref:Uncharacterized protein n=1 Tax=Mycena albidolilacea TaxID=1033008 RepID=A0AAD7A2K2_9AGAR|nr:hypothetical protein DFH08DRAFT_865686 [Mycena albidolilacea]